MITMELSQTRDNIGKPEINLLAFLLAGLLLGTAAVADENGTGEQAAGPSPIQPFTPERYSIDRYSKLWSKSPFEFEIVVQDAVEDEENPMDDMALYGYTSEGSIFNVTIYDKKKPDKKIRLQTGQKHSDGYEIMDVEKGQNYKETKVQIRNGSFEGFVTYDDKRISAKPTGAKGLANSRNKAQKNRRSVPPRNGRVPPAGKADDNSKQDRSIVIQRLLDKAKQNQASGDGNTGITRPRRRRVVLPPSSNK